MGKHRFHHNNWSQHINYERTIVKISIVEIVPQKKNCKTGDNIPATIIQKKIKTYRFILDIKFVIFDVKLLIISVLSVIQI